MELFLLWIALCFVAAVIADKKGRSGGWIFLLSFFFSPVVGIIVAIAIQPNTSLLEKQSLHNGDAKKCPACAELIKLEAVKCRYCGTDLVRTAAGESANDVTARLAAALANQSKRSGQ